VRVRGAAALLREASDALRTPLSDPSQAENALPDGIQALRLAEFVVGAGSRLIGQSVGAVRLDERYGIAVAGGYLSDSIGYRAEATDVSAVRLDAGDILLVRGTEPALVALERDEGLMQLHGALDLPHTARAKTAIAIVAGVVAAAALGIVPIAIAALVGTILMLLLRCIRFEDLGRALSLEVILLVAASIALGRALVETGAASWLGSGFASAVADWPPAAVLAVLMAFISVLTNFVSNASAAAIGTPIGISIAESLGVDPEPFVIAVVFACNICYVTPQAYQTNLLIMSAARYRFSDFVRAGLPLAVLMISVLAVLLVRTYSL
jgi:di/tricarboxylate transporter